MQSRRSFWRRGKDRLLGLALDIGDDLSPSPLRVKSCP
jgi:hypothetical protein